MLAGDVLFVAGRGPVSAVIRFGQWLRPELRPYCRWTHCAIAVDEHTVVEARFRGVRRVTLAADTSPKEPFRVVPLEMNIGYREAIARYALSVVGEEYGVAQIAGMLLSLATGGRLLIGENGHLICSELVCRALERSRRFFPRDEAAMTPADVARALKVTNP